MATARVFPLESLRTDGWFERIGEGIGSFQTLCEVIGTRFFAFAMIAGARIVALTIDRRVPDNTLVDFVVAEEGETPDEPSQRLTLGEFRKRLVAALVTEEPSGAAPIRLTDIEAIQRHIGVRYLLLAPIFGYSLFTLSCDSFGSMLRLRRDGLDEVYELEEFRSRIRMHVRDELQRAARGNKGAIDLARVPEAEQAAQAGDSIRVLELLGTWPAPLAIFLRTPEGQALGVEPRMKIATALAVLGQACIELGETEKGQEILRLGIQYAGDTPTAALVYQQLGRMMMSRGRFGEAIGPLRRAANLGGDGKLLWALLAEAFAERRYWLAAYAAALEAKEAGATDEEVREPLERSQAWLGERLANWQRALTTG